MTIKNLGTFKVENRNNPTKIQKRILNIGINDCGDFIIKKKDCGGIGYVVNKVCDHAGGRLTVRGNKAVCPLHNWELNLESLEYKGSTVCKNQQSYQIVDNGDILVADNDPYLVNPYRSDMKGQYFVRWVNHACVLIEVNGQTLLTDPWLLGPAFLTGWWLQQPSPEDAIELLQTADYVYISHNHSDHLHEETLSYLSKDKLIITPSFSSQSSLNSIKKLGFTNVMTPVFNTIIELCEGFQISILDSGDFRDDSGLYICANGREILLTVDSNILNNNILPTDIDLLMTSFAGGSSGFPLCYESFTEIQKKRICEKNLKALKLMISKYIEVTSPKYYMPYAGMFTEASNRDRDIRIANSKNSIDDISRIAKNRNVGFITPSTNKLLVGNIDGINEIDVHRAPLTAKTPQIYVDNLKQKHPYDVERIKAYFRQCEYKDEQILHVIPTDDYFKDVVGDIICVDFSDGSVTTISENEIIVGRLGYKVMSLKVRPEVFMKVVTEKLPWEEISIGFQMRVNRYPDEYEVGFWYYFTNIYID